MKNERQRQALEQREDEVRARLREAGMSLTKDSPDGVILRTAAQDMSEECLEDEYARLRAQWADM